jgi:hypothetical protein
VEKGDEQGEPHRGWLLNGCYISRVCEPAASSADARVAMVLGHMLEAVISKIES